VDLRNVTDDAHEPSFAEPPLRTNTQGELRRVGIELEMAGLEIDELTAVVVDVLGGTVERESAFVSHVRGTELGDFRAELDAELLKSRGYQEVLGEMGIDLGEGDLREGIEALLSRVAGLVVPLELVGPPAPWTTLARLDQVRAKLREAGARGTEASALYAFGMQLNVEAARLDAEYLLAILRAFLLAYDWLLEREHVDLARKLSPYVQAYPEDYVAHVMQESYAPDIEALIDDFVALTPTRNRPLDMLPLFAHIDEDRVMAAPVERALIQPRPAFHYRLPNCLIDDPDWSLARAWNDWVEVERLAADPARLEEGRARRLADSSSLARWLSEARRRLKS
jgi:hypothetical protein